jgi:metal-responsive CopG/Arc/MetJ family transcriptional regulator
MAIERKSEQCLTYLKKQEREELDEAVDELGISRADWIRQAVLEALGRRRDGIETMKAAGEYVVVGEVPASS